MGLFKLRVMVKVTQNRISFGCIFERRRGAGVPTHDTRVKTGIIQRIVTRDPKTLKTVSWSRRCPPCRTPDGITSVIQRCLGSSTNHNTYTSHALPPTWLSIWIRSEKHTQARLKIERLAGSVFETGCNALG